MPVIWRLATLLVRSSTLVVRDLDKVSPPIADTEIGTDCRLSERLVAVTMISPGAGASAAGAPGGVGAVCASADAAASAADMAINAPPVRKNR